MLCAVTIRSIKPGSFDDFRREWEPRPWPPELRRVLVSRNEQDPDQVLTASFLEVALEHFDELRDHPALLGAEEDRLSRIASTRRPRLQGHLRSRRGASRSRGAGTIASAEDDRRRQCAGAWRSTTRRRAARR